MSSSAEDNLSIGIKLFKSGQFKESYERLQKAFESYPENLELNFYLGRAAFETENYEMAIMTFERILIASPFESRVKLEMARSFQRLGANNTAKQYCREVLASNPPKLVKDNIERFLIYIDQTEQKHFFSGELIMGINWDNNIWASPSTSTIQTIIGDVKLTGPSSKKTNDWFFNTRLEIDHTYRPLNSDYFWRTEANFFSGIYNETSELDIRYIEGITGPEFILGKKNRLGFKFLLDNIQLDDTEYQNGVGAKAVLDCPIKSNLVTSTEVKYILKDFPGTPERESKNLSLSFDMDLGFKKYWYSLGLHAERENAFDDEYSYNRYITMLSITREFPFNITGVVRYDYLYSHYDKPAALFNEKRRDHNHVAGFSLEKRIWTSLLRPNHNISLRLGYLHTWADSNIDLYEYKKDIFQSALIYNF